MLTKRQIENKITRLQVRLMDYLEAYENINAEHMGHGYLTIGHPAEKIQIATVYNRETRDFDFVIKVMKDTKREIVTTLAGENKLYMTVDIVKHYLELYDIDKNYTGFLKGV